MFQVSVVIHHENKEHYVVRMYIIQ